MTVDANPAHDVFLSYSREDASMVEALAERLADDHGFKVWLDKWKLVPGEPWQREVIMGLETARTCAICYGMTTPDGWFREEIEFAITRQVSDRNFRVIPVILPNAQRSIVEGFPQLRMWADFGDGHDDAIITLAAGINGVPRGRFRAAARLRSDDRLHEKKLDKVAALLNQGKILPKVAEAFQTELLSKILQCIGDGDE